MSFRKVKSNFGVCTSGQRPSLRNSNLSECCQSTFLSQITVVVTSLKQLALILKGPTDLVIVNLSGHSWKLWLRVIWYHIRSSYSCYQWGKIEEQLPKKSVSRLLADCPSTVGWRTAHKQLTVVPQTANCRPTSDQHLVDSFPNLNKKVIGWKFADSRFTVGQLLVTCQLSVDNMLVHFSII